MSVASSGGMVRSWRRVTAVALGAIYLTGAAFLAGLVTTRIGADRERMINVRAREQRAREVRAQAIRIELQQAAGTR